MVFLLIAKSDLLSPIFVNFFYLFLAASDCNYKLSERVHYNSSNLIDMEFRQINRCCHNSYYTGNLIGIDDLGLDDIINRCVT